MNYLICAAIGYLLGSVPTGYLILKREKGIDIRQAGSGNVGALNAMEVSNSKIIGLFVLIIDALKGLFSVYLAILFFPYDFVMPAIALTFAVFSHCFNPWLGFNGGRGLATAAGGTMLIFPVLPAVWIIIWVALFILKRDVHFANITAIILTFIAVMFSQEIDFRYSFPHSYSVSILLFFTSVLMMIIFIKHIEPLKEIIKNYKEAKGKNEE